MRTSPQGASQQSSGPYPGCQRRRGAGSSLPQADPAAHGAPALARRQQARPPDPSLAPSQRALRAPARRRRADAEQPALVAPPARAIQPPDQAPAGAAHRLREARRGSLQSDEGWLAQIQTRTYRSADSTFSTAAPSAFSPPPAASPTERAISTTNCRYESNSPGAFDSSAAFAFRSASSVSRSTFSGEAARPNPVPCMSASSRTRPLELPCLACAMCFASEPASLNVSKKLRSLKDTRKPAPVTPFCNDSHS